MSYLFKNPFQATTDTTTPGANIYSDASGSNTISNFAATFTLIPPGIQFTYNVSIAKITGGATTENLRFGLRRLATAAGLANGLQDQIYYVEYAAGWSSPQIINGILPGDSANYGTPTLFSVTSYVAGPTVTTKTSQFFNSVTESDSRWYAIDNRTVRITAVQSQYYGSFTFAGSGSSPVELPVFPFTLEYGDMIRLYNSSSRAFGREDEYRVVSTYQANSGGTSYYYAILDRSLSILNVDSGSFPSYVSKYMCLKHIPDETNLILNYSSSTNIPQDGLVFPQYINPIVKKNSGNLVKALKQQNLI